jgi:hypothetical protein
MDETPMSKTAPSSLALPLSSNASASPEKGVRISWNCPEKSRATASANGCTVGSRSSATTSAPRSRMARV